MTENKIGNASQTDDRLTELLQIRMCKRMRMRGA